jgi:hypothetical protein
MVLVTTLLCVAAVGAAASAWEYEFRPAKAEYVVYGDSLGDTIPPSKKGTVKFPF